MMKIMWPIERIAITMVAVVVAPLALAGQAPTRAEDAPVFEVASVKANTSGDVMVRLQALPGGRFTATNVTLRGLIRFAYQLQDYQVVNGPGWWTSARFDVVAKAPDNAAPEGMRVMLQSLLADRFTLVAHQEKRDMPTYELVLARADGRLGDKLRRSAIDCTNAPPAAPGPFVPNSPCGFFGPSPGAPIRLGMLGFRGLTMAAFARSLTPMVERPVIDRTGLSGHYDADFDAPSEIPPPPPPPGIPDPIDRGALVSIVTILPRDLGLKLEPSRGSIEVLVIDSVQRLIED